MQIILRKERKSNEQGNGWREERKEAEAGIFLSSLQAPQKHPLFCLGRGEDELVSLKAVWLLRWISL